MFNIYNFTLELLNPVIIVICNNIFWLTKLFRSRQLNNYELYVIRTPCRLTVNKTKTVHSYLPINGDME